MKMRKIIVFAAALNSTLVSCFNLKPSTTVSTAQTSGIRLWSSWDDDTEYPSFEEGSDDFGEKKLGVNFGEMIGPLSPEELSEIKEEVRKNIDDKFDEKLGEISKLKEQMAKDFEESKKTMEFASELNFKREGEKLMNKIDAMSDKFLKESEEMRTSTKMAAMADRAMENSGQGIELGSWGLDQDGNMVTTGITFGSIASNSINSKPTIVYDDFNDSPIEDSVVEDVAVSPPQTKILAVIDEGEVMDKNLLDAFTNILQKSIPETTSVEVERISPLKPAPIGGLNCQTVIMFASSLSDRRSVETILERVLKRTAPVAGSISTPPTHIVCVSSLGTKRTDKLPYSMMNFMGGKKLEKRRDMEEAVMSRTKRGDYYRPLDYTIVKFGKTSMDPPKKGGQGEGIILEEGDSLDGDIGLDAAAHVLLQAMAFQPGARNVTLSATSTLSGEDVARVSQEEWNDMFLRVDGPELYRLDVPLAEDASDEVVRVKYERLKEYIEEWAVAMFVKKTTGTGLTTPVTVEASRRDASATSSSVKILFKQTATGSAYTSKDEERAMERQMGGSTNNKSQNTDKVIPMRKQKKEGGLEVVIEMKPGETPGSLKLRVRGRRCNMGDNTVVKEISEGVLLKKSKEAVQFWIENQSSD